MRKTMIRNSALMGFISIVMGIILALYLRSTFANPVMGNVYTATKKGYHSEITVETVIHNGKILSVNADFSGETENFGQVAGPQLLKAIQEAGSLNGVDGVAGCTYTSNAVLKAVQDCLDQDSMTAGAVTYTATMKGMHGDVPFTVGISNGKIVSIDADFSHEDKEYGQVAGPKMVQAILAAGTTQGVDAVAGCTYTSNAILDTVNDCLAQAGL